MEATLEKELEGERGAEEPTLVENAIFRTAKSIQSVASSLAGFVHDPRPVAEHLPDALLSNTSGSSPPRCGGSNRKGLELGIEDQVVVIGGGCGGESAEDVQVIGDSGKGEGQGEDDGSGKKACAVDGASEGVDVETEKRREGEEKLQSGRGGDDDGEEEKEKTKAKMVEDVY